MGFLKKFNLNYFITLYFLLLSSNSNSIALDNLYWIAFQLFLLLLALFRGEVNPRNVKAIGLFTVVYMAFIYCRCFVSELSEQFFLSDIAFLLKYVYASFLFCIVLKHKAISYIAEVVIHLTVISFVFYGIQLLAEDSLANFCGSVSPPIVTGYDGGIYYNIFIFTMHVGRHDFRNCGYMWEPGAFACILILAMLYHLFSTRFRIDLKILILFAGLVTTFSTTGYLALFVLLFLTYRYRVPKFNLWLLVIIPIVAAIFIFTPILKDKIIAVYEIDMISLGKVLRHKHPDQSNLAIALDRFASMMYICKFWGDDLLWGVGNNYMVLMNRNFPVVISNGVFSLMVQFGVIGLIYLFYRYAKFCFTFVLKWELMAYCVVALFICSFSECILNMPFILIFMFLPYSQIEWNTLMLKPQMIGRKLLFKSAGI